MRFIRLTFILLLTGTLQLFAASDLSGTYRVEGTYPKGGTYSGSLTITIKNGVHHFSWRIGKSSYSGKGTLQGNRIEVDWGAKHPVIYSVDDKGNLIGTWSEGKAKENAYLVQKLNSTDPPRPPVTTTNPASNTQNKERLSEPLWPVAEPRVIQCPALREPNCAYPAPGQVFLSLQRAGKHELGYKSKYLSKVFYMGSNGVISGKSAPGFVPQGAYSPCFQACYQVDCSNRRIVVSNPRSNKSVFFEYKIFDNEINFGRVNKKKAKLRYNFMWVSNSQTYTDICPAELQGGLVQPVK